MDRFLWQSDITQTRCPPWTCPACRKHKVMLIEGSLVCHETVASKRLQDHEAFDLSGSHTSSPHRLRAEAAAMLAQSIMARTLPAPRG